MATSVEKQIDALSHQYKRHGGKDNREKQINTLKRSCRWIADRHNINRLEQFGKHQITDYYRHHKDRSYSTLMGYHYAFCVLWKWLGRNSKPPKPEASKSAFHNKSVNP